jgi:uncharacterized protein
MTSMKRQAVAAEHDRSEPRRGRLRRRLLTIFVIVVVLVLLLLFAASWYFSGQIRDGIAVKELDLQDNVRVTQVSADSVTLEPLDETPDMFDQDRVYGLDWGEGHGQIGDVVDEDGDAVTRSLDIFATPAPTVGDTARFTRDGYPWEAPRALEVPVRQVDVPGPQGELPAWLAPGDGGTWAILVHGRGATRSEMFRLMRTTTDLDLPSLAISYRADPENGGGLARFGEEEWPDLEAAVQYALDQGADDVVLLGASMGGAISAAFLESSDLAGSVRAVVLDAPMLDFSATIAHGADQREVPGLGTAIPSVVVWGALQVSAQRFDLDLDAVDYLDDTSWLDVPALVIHGTEDLTVPDAVTRELAEAEGDLVQEHYVEEAEHVGSWNIDPEQYDAWVAEFLESQVS